MKKFIPRLLAVLLVLALLVVGSLYCLGRFYKDFTNDPAITYKGEKITELSGIAISKAEPLQLGVPAECSVKISAAENVALTYIVDGKEQAFNVVEDFNNGFDISYADGTLTFTPVGNLEQLLEKVHNGADVVLPAVNYDVDLFTLTLTNDDLQVTISFGLYLYNVTGVSITEKVVF